MQTHLVVSLCDLFVCFYKCTQYEKLTSPSIFITSDDIIYRHLKSIRAAKENHSFYDIQFIPDKELLIVYGDPGILLYKWSDIQRALQSSQSDIQPIATFHPHPSPCREAIEINSTSYDAQNNVLYAASGDGFGCYQWDLETERLLGTFGRSNRGEHVDYLHTVRVVGEHVITGGEDGKMVRRKVALCIKKHIASSLIRLLSLYLQGFWSGKERKLIQIYDIRNTMDENTQLVAGQKSNRGFLNNSSVWNNGSNLWISSIELNSNWLAVAGGAEQGQHNGITARSSSTHSISGFMTMWHLPTRSFSSGCLTRESIHSMVYNPSLDLFVTGGNEGRISYWECTSAKRVGRAWCSSSATYALTVLPENGRMFAGGSGGVVDCFVDRVRIAELRV